MIGKYPKNRELRRQRVLKSKWFDEMFENLYMNQVFRCFELVGVYDEYCLNNDQNKEFKEFYDSCVEENTLYYQNIGTHVIIKKINKKRNDNELGEIDYEISRRCLTFFGLKRRYRVARVYESSAVVLNLLLGFIKSNEKMAPIYRDRILKHTMDEYFTYQNTLLRDYIDSGKGMNTATRECFVEVERQLANAIGE